MGAHWGRLLADTQVISRSVSMARKSIRNKPRRKPAKPYRDFPLTANGNGQWSEKIRGRVYYFGPWADPDAALERYLEVKDDLHPGRRPRPKDGFTLFFPKTAIHLVLAGPGWSSTLCIYSVARRRQLQSGLVWRACACKPNGSDQSGVRSTGNLQAAAPQLSCPCWQYMLS